MSSYARRVAGFRFWSIAVLSAAVLQFGAVSTAAPQSGDFPDLSQLQPDTVVAVVNGNPISFASIVYAHQQLPGSYRDLPLAQIMPQVVQLVIEQRLLAEEAARNSMHQGVKYQAALQFEADRLLQEQFIASAVTGRVGDRAELGEVPAAVATALTAAVGTGVGLGDVVTVAA